MEIKTKFNQFEKVYFMDKYGTIKNIEVSNIYITIGTCSTVRISYYFLEGASYDEYTKDEKDCFSSIEDLKLNEIQKILDI